jgi:hypothetical protein
VLFTCPLVGVSGAALVRRYADFRIMCSREQQREANQPVFVGMEWIGSGEPVRIIMKNPARLIGPPINWLLDAPGGYGPWRAEDPGSSSVTFAVASDP